MSVCLPVFWSVSQFVSVCAPDPRGIWSRTQMWFTPGPKCHSVTDSNGVWSQTQMQFSPRPKWQLFLDPNVISSRTQIPFGPEPKWDLVPDPNVSQSQTQIWVRPGFKCISVPDSNANLGFHCSVLWWTIWIIEYTFIETFSSCSKMYRLFFLSATRLFAFYFVFGIKLFAIIVNYIDNQTWIICSFSGNSMYCSAESKIIYSYWTNCFMILPSAFILDRLNSSAIKLNNFLARFWTKLMNKEYFYLIA